MRQVTEAEFEIILIDLIRALRMHHESGAEKAVAVRINIIEQILGREQK